jgi:SAM-dependent MidA family methyltransferase
MPREVRSSVASELRSRLGQAIAAAGGWLPFDRVMAIALYEPGLGYYSRAGRKFGLLPRDGSDFVTAPELSPLFGHALARQVVQGLDAAGSGEVFEFGAGSGALAAQLLEALGPRIERYAIVDVSGSLRERQAATLAPWRGRVQWLDAWPERIEGVVLGNEVLDAMPVQLLHFDGQEWFERGVAWPEGASAPAWADRVTPLRPPLDAAFVPGTVTEIHPQAEAFVRSLAERLHRGLALFIDYGFPEAEFYLPQRHMGTLMAHRAHRSSTDVLADLGQQDITAHVNFSAVALAAQDAGLDVLGYTTQAHFLVNCGLLDLPPPGDVRASAAVGKLLNEHEMGELFKVLALGRGIEIDPIGFVRGDRMRTL